MMILNDKQCRARSVVPTHDKTYSKTCANSEDSDQLEHPRSLIRVFADRMCLLQHTVCGLSKEGETTTLAILGDVHADLILCFLHRSHCWNWCAWAHICSGLLSSH